MFKKTELFHDSLILDLVIDMNDFLKLVCNNQFIKHGSTRLLRQLINKNQSGIVIAFFHLAASIIFNPGDFITILIVVQR